MSPTPPPYPVNKIALLGFGNVGQAFIELLIEKEQGLMDKPGIGFQVVGIGSGTHGRAIDPRGLPLQKVLDAYQSGTSLDEFSSIPVADSTAFIKNCGADALIETTPVDYQTGEPAISYLRQALEMGIHAITANKGPVVHGYRELKALAKRKKISFLFESTVMDGAPVFSIARSGLPGACVTSFSGILNSTTNMILTRMESGETQEEAIRYAQSIGIAETDPSGDVDGWDAAVKIAALVTVLMDIPFTPEMVERTGIREISSEMIEQAAENNQRWKLVCTAERDPAAPKGIKAVVDPRLVNQESHLYNVIGTSSILEISSDVLGKLSLIEENPSPRTTAYGILADLLNALAEN